MPNKLEIISAYRHLYRGLLKAVQYSSPARRVVRDQLRLAFRNPVLSTATGTPIWDAEGIKRTKWFLDAAAKEKGIEHRILKNLIKVRFLSGKDTPSWKRALHETRAKDPLKQEKPGAMQHYEMTVAMLNKSMGLLLR